MKEHTQMDNRTINITNMPDDYLNDYLSGRLSFDEVYSLYPGPDVNITEIPETTPDTEDN
jgi:hypothetical protein